MLSLHSGEKSLTSNSIYKLQIHTVEINDLTAEHMVRLQEKPDVRSELQSPQDSRRHGSGDADGGSGLATRAQDSGKGGFRKPASSPHPTPTTVLSMVSS